MNNKEEIEKKIISILEERTEILFAYIFGSFITSEKYDDLDIAIFISKDFDYNNLELYPYGYESAIISLLSIELKTEKIDLILLNKADLLLSTQVYNKGKLLFDKDKLLRVKIENAVRKEYIDTEHFRLIKSKNIRKLLNV